MTTVEEDFERVAAQLLAEDEDLQPARMFGSTGLKAAGKVFAMVVKGDLVVKLPAARVIGLLADGAGRPFDPGHGRVLREWIALRPSDRSSCGSYLREAHSFAHADFTRSAEA